MAIWIINEENFKFIHKALAYFDVYDDKIKPSLIYNKLSQSIVLRNIDGSVCGYLSDIFHIIACKSDPQFIVVHSNSDLSYYKNIANNALVKKGLECGGKLLKFEGIYYNYGSFYNSLLKDSVTINTNIAWEMIQKFLCHKFYKKCFEDKHGCKFSIENTKNFIIEIDLHNNCSKKVLDKISILLHAIEYIKGISLNFLKDLHKIQNCSCNEFVFGCGIVVIKIKNSHNHFDAHHHSYDHSSYHCPYRKKKFHSIVIIGLLILFGCIPFHNSYRRKKIK